MKKHMKRIPEPIKQNLKKFFFPTPRHLSSNQIKLDRDKLCAIEKSIKENYHTGPIVKKLTINAIEKDLNDHLINRLENDRRLIVPWLDDVGALKNKRVLEIGCGTGSSTVALAEQGAKVTGIDIDEGSLVVAKERSRIYGLDIEIRKLTSIEIINIFDVNAFDIIIFFASLEHMTISERLISLRDMWEMLAPDGLLVIIETPNRLWFFDSHTSNLPFFHWLPDEMAFKYSRFSSRKGFHDLYREYNADSKLHFLRRGRGMSFHELDIAIGPSEKLNVISSLGMFWGVGQKLMKSRLDRKYNSLLKEIYPNIHKGFFDEYLNIIIKK